MDKITIKCDDLELMSRFRSDLVGYGLREHKEWNDKAVREERDDDIKYSAWIQGRRVFRPWIRFCDGEFYFMSHDFMDDHVYHLTEATYRICVTLALFYHVANCK